MLHCICIIIMYIARYLIQFKKSFMTLSLLANTLEHPRMKKKHEQDQHDLWGISCEAIIFVYFMISCPYIYYTIFE